MQLVKIEERPGDRGMSEYRIDDIAMVNARFPTDFRAIELIQFANKLGLSGRRITRIDDCRVDYECAHAWLFHWEKMQ